MLEQLSQQGVTAAILFCGTLIVIVVLWPSSCVVSCCTERNILAIVLVFDLCGGGLCSPVC